MPTIKGFSKLTKQKKLQWIAENYFQNPAQAIAVAQQYWNTNKPLQQLHDEFIENTLSNFYLPLGIAPNFIINKKEYAIPMVVEESSVVAAAANAAKFWGKRGGFKATILGTKKIGHVHFNYIGSFEKLETLFNQIKPLFFQETNSITQNMQKRGGGITSLKLINKTNVLENYYQIEATFETKDSMGANFINSCLEQFAKTLQNNALNYTEFTEQEKNIQIIMCILSNYVPNCKVRAEVSCPIADLAEKNIENPQEFAEKFVRAVQIAKIEPYRAVTHNKGIMNGIDAVVVATGNDFRAVEAGIHAYASRNGQYSSLSDAKIENNTLYFWLEVPLALGTVGGLTSLHPLVKFSLDLLQNPSAEELMKIVSVTGLAQNFAALKSLTTTGIQKGHMKMHLGNILNQHKATPEERKKVFEYFKDTTILHSSVVQYLEKIRT